jgi:hypothetical protein
VSEHSGLLSYPVDGMNAAFHVTTAGRMLGPTPRIPLVSVGGLQDSFGEKSTSSSQSRFVVVAALIDPAPDCPGASVLPEAVGSVWRGAPRSQRSSRRGSHIPDRSWHRQLLARRARQSPRPRSRPSWSVTASLVSLVLCGGRRYRQAKVGLSAVAPDRR